MGNRNYLVPLFFLFALQAFGQTYSFTHKSLVRSYIVHLPPGYSNTIQYPLVINMHGYSSTAAQQQTYSQMNTVADTGKFIVVYPDGVNNAWNGGFGTNSTVDDVGFLSALIDTMKKNFSVNSLKVYACGLSNGGFMSFRLACELEDKIAAIAPVAGLMSDSTRLFCQNTCPVPVMYFHGTADGVVNYNGTLGYVSVDSTIKIWVGKDGCPATPVVTAMPDINPGDGCTATKYVYSPGQKGSEVVFFKITNGGHTWPGGFPVPTLGNTNQDVKASGEIWNFFKKHSLQCGLNAVSESETRERFSVFPNPSNGKFEIQLSGSAIENICVLNILGEVICKMYAPQDHPMIDISNHGQGVYVIRIGTSAGVYTQKIIKQ